MKITVVLEYEHLGARSVKTATWDGENPYFDGVPEKDDEFCRERALALFGACVAIPALPKAE